MKSLKTILYGGLILSSLSLQASLPPLEDLPLKEALQSTFHTDHYTVEKTFHDGFSGAHLYKIEVLGKVYVARFIPHKSQESAQIEIDWLTHAEKYGGPKIYYANVAQRIILLEFIPQKAYPAHLSDKNIIEFGEKLRKLHGDPSLKTHDLFNKIFTLAASISLPKSFFGNKILNDLLQAMPELQSLFLHTGVSLSHGDLHQNNLLFTGEEFRMIDWESAGLQDPFVDLSGMADFVIMDDSKNDLFLKSYFGRDPTPEEKAHLYLMQVVNLFLNTLRTLKHLPEAAQFNITPAEFEHLISYSQMAYAFFHEGKNKDVPFLTKLVWAMFKEAHEKIKNPTFKEAIRLLKEEQEQEIKKILHTKVRFG